MKTNIDISTDYIIDDEGGWVFVKRTGAVGNMGIGMATLISWRHLMHATAMPTVDDLRHLTRAEAKAIYSSSLYAEHIGFDALPSGLDYAALDAAVNEGAHGALILLAATTQITDVLDRVKAISDMRLAAKRLRPDWNDRTVNGELIKGHGVGWTRRIGELVPSRAQLMIGGH